MATRRPKSLKALLLTAAISILAGLGYLLIPSPDPRTPDPRTPDPRIEAPGVRAITGRVVGVSDGDTITVLAAGNRQLKVRLDGIDAPESKQPFGVKSKQSLSELVYGRTVTVTGSKTDRYGRTVGNVAVDGQDVGLVQIERGNAWFYTQYARELGGDRARDYEQAERRARAERIGLWADRKPIEPWEWRADKRTIKNVGRK
jgi:endonuclease YncB( thermonuclease family)